MKHINNYKRFIVEQAQPEKVSNPINQTFSEEDLKNYPTLGKDIKGNTITEPPSEKTVEVKSGKIRSVLHTKKIVNPKITMYGNKTWWDHLTASGYKPVWKEVIEVAQVINESKPLPPNRIVIDLGGSDYFVLGGFTLNENAKKFIKEKLIEAKGVDYRIDSYQIESSTDKTRVMDKLQGELKKMGFEKTENNSWNEGLSKAREQSIKNYIQSLNLGGNFLDPILKWEQGSINDQKSRYVLVKVDLIAHETKPVINKNKDIPNEIWWFQKYFERPIPTRLPNDGPDNYPTAPGQCPQGIIQKFLQPISDWWYKRRERRILRKASKEKNERKFKK